MEKKHTPVLDITEIRNYSENRIATLRQNFEKAYEERIKYLSYSPDLIEIHNTKLPESGQTVRVAFARNRPAKRKFSIPSLYRLKLDGESYSLWMRCRPYTKYHFILSHPSIGQDEIGFPQVVFGLAMAKIL